jgi:3-phosphoshikimate 1-carboxyvinyltransferase
MSELRISPPNQPLRGTLRVPADKSISHRAVILGALADGDTRIENLLQSETTRATVNGMCALGADIQEPAPNTLVVHGRGLHSLRESKDILFCAGSGTTMRLLAGLCAGQDFLSILDGTPALKRRPMGRVVEPLRAMGATIMARAGDRLPPLAVRGAFPLRGIDYTLPVASAQVKSALLLAGLFANSPTTLYEPAASRDHTERMLRAFGVEIKILDSEFPADPSDPKAPKGPWGLGRPRGPAGRGGVRVYPTPEFRIPRYELRIPGDFSSAAFFIAAALLVPGSEICLERVGLNPTRTGLLDALTRMGATIKIENQGEENDEPVGDLIVRAEELGGTEVGGDEIPRMIDEFPIFAICATQARGETRVREAAELRVKESDRIASLTAELRKMGAQIEPQADGFTIAGPARLRGARVDAHADHRLAMSLAVAALVAEGETIIEGWECVGDSFPNFADILLAACQDSPARTKSSS